MITIKLNEILCAIKNMHLDELYDMQGALESEDTIVHIDVRGELELSNVKVDGANISEDIEHIWPKSPVSNPPNWAHQPVMPTYPWSPLPLVPDPSNPLNPWHITATTNRMPEVSIVPLSEQNQSEQMCHSLNISGYNGDAYFSTGAQDNYLNDLLRK